MPPKVQLATTSALSWDDVVNIGNDLGHLTKELHQMRKRKRRLEIHVPPQVLTASMILFCRCGNKQRLLEFLKWKTAAEKEDLNRWASDVVKWKEQAKENVCKLYENGNATLSLRRAAVLVTKFTNERSLHGWVEEINVTLGVSPDTTVIMQELPKHGLEGKPRNATDSQRQHRSSLQFWRRWRKRWGVQEGPIPIGEKLSLKELLAKV